MCHMNIKPVVITALSVYLCGCAGHSPIVDTKGVDMSNYEVDLAECQQYAKQVGTGKEAAAGAGIGAALGWAISAVTKEDRGEGAGVGAITGGATGLGRAAASQKNVVSGCLRGRGYNVLN